MRPYALAALLLCPAVLLQAQVQQSASVTGRWVATVDLYGTTIYWPLNLTDKDGKLTGDFTGDKLEGAVTGNQVHFLAKDDSGGSEEVSATLTGSAMKGTLVFINSSDPTRTPSRRTFSATLPPARDPNHKPQRHDFVPTTFYRQFSSANAPVLHVWPGDTIHTTTVDAGGSDEKGVPRVLGGNPETGPFFIETAMPGDTLVIHINHLRLNRDYAISDDALVPRSVNSGLAVKMKDTGKSVRWHLDLDKNVATTDRPGEHLKPFSVPLKPMLGCVAVAPPPAAAAPQTGDSGQFGGNMDFNEVVEGNTLYLPISNPGALLYIGDGHAAQGDGELNGDALETSMDVEITVDVIPGRNTPAPRVESAQYIMAMGLDGSLDDAFRRATANMALWLDSDYKLTPSEIAQVLGTSAEYKVSEVADRNAGVVLKLRKDRLASIKPPPGTTPGKPDPSIPTISH